MVATVEEPSRREGMERTGAEHGHAAYVPGLDGLRAVAVLAVITYHHAPSSVPGGFLGVSTFFVLSGYLIGSLCFAEVGRTGSIRARTFWERRIRRLMPAALTTLLLVVAMGRIWGVTGGTHPRGDLLAALTWCANWRFLGEGAGYQAAFADPSPVQHFWSLAIEEQFYVVLPLLVIGLARLARGDWRRIRLLVGGLTVAFVVLSAWTAQHRGFEQAYYATSSRAGELLVGVLLAALLTGDVARLGRAHRTRTAAQVAATIGLVGLIGAAARVDLGSSRLFSAIIPLNAAATAAVIIGCLVGGPVARVLSLWPLRAIGRISYGVYLFHWPLYLLLDEARTGLDGSALFVLRFAVTLAVAVVSYHLIEAPIRFRRWPAPSRIFPTALAGVAVTGMVIIALPPKQSEAQRAAAVIGTQGFDGPNSAQLTGSEKLRPVRDVVVPKEAGRTAARLLVVGDSVAQSMLAGFVGWNEDNPDHQVAVDHYTQMGCPLAGGIARLEMGGRKVGVWPSCQLLVEAMDRLDASRYDAVIVVIGLGDLGNRKLGDEWQHLGDADFDRRLRARMDGLATAFDDTPVFWATYPEVEMRHRPGQTGPGPYDENDPARLDALNRMIRATAERHPEVTLLEMSTWCRAQPNGCLGDDLRPDGVHFSWDGAKRADVWAMPQILGAIGVGQPG